MTVPKERKKKPPRTPEKIALDNEFEDVWNAVMAMRPAKKITPYKSVEDGVYVVTSERED